MGAQELTPAPPGARMVRLCHDIRQHVAAALMLAEASAEDATGNEQRLDGVVRELRLAIDMVSAELDEASRRSDVVDLVELVEQCVDTVRLTREVGVTVRTAEVKTLAYGNPARLRRVIVNVLDNAARAAGKRGAVVVRVRPWRDLACIEVLDEGPGFGGIAAGGGHGLSIVNQALRDDRGRLEITSDPGKGTRVRLLWPQQPTPR